MLKTGKEKLVEDGWRSTITDDSLIPIVLIAVNIGVDYSTN